MDDFDLDGLLDETASHVDDELASMPDVVSVGADLDVNCLPHDERVWHRADDVVAVVADLKSSTQLGLNKRAPSTASIYEATTGNIAVMFERFAADFVAIQGDGAFGLFWGLHRKRRAICCAISIKTFSERHLVPKLTSKWPDGLPETGLKLGVANSPILAKFVGLSDVNNREPVWAGRAVNYAAKCAQQADAREMIVTGSIWDWISRRDYLAVSCDCASPTADIWEDVTINRIPDANNDGEKQGKLLTSTWCKVHGQEYCNAVLNGKRSRSTVESLVASALAEEMKSPIRMAASARRQEIRESSDLQRATATRRRDDEARRRGMRNIGR